MAVYEYQCPMCADVVEVMHKMDQAPVVICERCNEGAECSRIISATHGRVKNPAGGAPSKPYYDKSMKPSEFANSTDWI